MSTNMNIPDKMNPDDPRFVNWAQNLLNLDDENLEFEESNGDFRDKEDVKEFAEESSDEDYFQNEGFSSEDEPEGATENKEEFYFGRNKFKWRKEEPLVNVRTRKHNIVITLPGLRAKARNE
ncbi:hypothetical protein RN001_006629 [Aquatica leii]|uniref:Uncharacterized protein n=1 Tax=Aquatica leii TaxID=1421715 RepID=A0AAN7Q8Z6_9COLE|nr:hypothetical protein RN001_006629 [Aquatica leii]